MLFIRYFLCFRDNVLNMYINSIYKFINGILDQFTYEGRGGEGGEEKSSNP